MVSFWPWGSDNTSPASFEKTLSALSAKITNTTATLDKTRARARRTKVLLVLYLGFAYLVYAIIQLVVVKYPNMGAVEWAGMAGGPILIIALRKLVGAFFTFRTDTLGKRLKDQQAERAKTIQKLKDATKYDSTMELIEKYGGEKKKAEEKKKDEKQQQQDQQQQGPNGPPNRTRLPPPPTANIQPRVPSGPHSPAPGSPPSSELNSLEPSAEFAPNAFSHPPPSQQQRPYSSSGGGETHWYDRIFDVLLGDDETLPKNRIVLVCQSCRLVNGQAPPGTRSLAEMGVWRCMACHAVNGEQEKDEGTRIVEEVLAQQDDEEEEEVKAQIKSEDEAVDVSGAGEKATGVESQDGAKQRRGKSH